MIFPRRPRLSIESSARQSRYFSGGATLQLLYKAKKSIPTLSSPERADHVAGPSTYRPLQDRISNRSGADGGHYGRRPRHRGGTGRGAGLAALRHAVGGESPR